MSQSALMKALTAAARLDSHFDNYIKILVSELQLRECGSFLGVFPNLDTSKTRSFFLLIP